VRKISKSHDLSEHNKSDYNISAYDFIIISVVNDNAGVIHELYINLKLIVIEEIWDSFTIGDKWS